MTRALRPAAGVVGALGLLAGCMPPVPEARLEHAASTVETGGLGASCRRMGPGGSMTFGLRYGPYLVVMNQDPETTHLSTRPLGPGKATDLLSGRRLDLSAPIEVPPATAFVVYLRPSD